VLFEVRDAPSGIRPVAAGPKSQENRGVSVRERGGRMETVDEAMELLASDTKRPEGPSVSSA
jgi:hypothetical protein